MTGEGGEVNGGNIKRGKMKKERGIWPKWRRKRIKFEKKD